MGKSGRQEQKQRDAAEHTEQCRLGKKASGEKKCKDASETARSDVLRCIFRVDARRIPAPVIHVAFIVHRRASPRLLIRSPSLPHPLKAAGE